MSSEFSQEHETAPESSGESVAKVQETPAVSAPVPELTAGEAAATPPDPPPPLAPEFSPAKPDEASPEPPPPPPPLPPEIPPAQNTAEVVGKMAVEGNTDAQVIAKTLEPNAVAEQIEQKLGTPDAEIPSTVRVPTANELTPDLSGATTVEQAEGIIAQKKLENEANIANAARQAEAVEAQRKASELVLNAEAQGWTRIQTEGGPLEYVDENGYARITIKKGSSRTPGSENPHVAFRDASGQRVDSDGNPVSRRSPDNHTPIDWDIE